ALDQLTLRVCGERAGNPRASCPGRYVELVQLIALQHEEAERITRRAGDPQVRGGGGEPVAETVARTVAAEQFGENRPVGVAPAVVPDGGERLDVGGNRVADWRQGNERLKPVTQPDAASRTAATAFHRHAPAPLPAHPLPA